MHDSEEECLTLFYAMVCLMLSQQKQLIKLTWTVIITDITKNHPIILLYKMTINHFSAHPFIIESLALYTIHVQLMKKCHQNNL